MMKVYGYVKYVNDFSKGCVISDDPPHYDIGKWTRFEAATSFIDEATGYMAVSLLFDRELIPASYSMTEDAALKAGKQYTLTTVIDAVPVRVVFGEGERLDI